MYEFLALDDRHACFERVDGKWFQRWEHVVGETPQDAALTLTGASRCANTVRIKYRRPWTGPDTSGPFEACDEFAVTIVPLGYTLTENVPAAFALTQALANTPVECREQFIRAAVDALGK